MQNEFIKNVAVVNHDSKSFAMQIKNNPDAVIIDVRTKMEYNQGRIANSKLIDIYKPGFIDEIQKLDKNVKYLIYCRSGNRSYFAVTKMLELGFTDVCHLGSGIIGWEGKVEY